MITSSRETIQSKYDSKNTISEKGGLESSLTVSLGLQNPVLYNIELTTSSYSFIVKQSMNDRKSLIKSTRFLYGNNLSALVTIVDDNLTFKTKAAADLVECNEQSTDVHFDSLANQIQMLKSEINSSKKLSLGDFVITKHSNLGEFQVLFHYVGENSRDILFLLSFHSFFSSFYYQIFFLNCLNVLIMGKPT